MVVFSFDKAIEDEFLATLRQIAKVSSVTFTAQEGIAQVEPSSIEPGSLLPLSRRWFGKVAVS